MQREWYRRAVVQAIQELGDVVVFRERRIDRAEFEPWGTGTRTLVFVNGERLAEGVDEVVDLIEIVKAHLCRLDDFA